MANFNSSIDAQVFAACRVAEISQRVLKSPVQPLLMGGPGCGKSYSVGLFAEVAGYELVMLRGNTNTNESITGYDVSPTDTTNEKSTKHLRPSWFQDVLSNQEKGLKTLLFLDEISTCNEFTQAALLQLLLERKVDTEDLPEDTLIVAAANYSANLSNSALLIPPLLNRFMIINIIPTGRDLPHFLSKYDGALTGARINFKGEIKKLLVDMDNQGMKDPSPEFIDKVGEMIEKCLLDEASQLCKEGVLDFGVSDLKDIYSEVEGKNALPGFITFRSLNFARDMAISSYLAFGKAGLVSDNFKNQLLGLIGMALSYEPKTGDVKKTMVVDRFAEALAETANDIEKMNNDKLPEYQNFFTTVLKSEAEGVISPANMTLMLNKINEMLVDRDLSKLDRPVDAEILKNTMKRILGTLKQSSMSSGSVENLTSITAEVAVSPEKYISFVNTWNVATGLISCISSIVGDPKKKYTQEVKQEINNDKRKCREYNFQLKAIRKSLIKSDPAVEKMIPTINAVQ